MPTIDLDAIAERWETYKRSLVGEREKYVVYTTEPEWRLLWEDVPTLIARVRELEERATAPTPALLIEIRDLLRGLTEREDRESRMEQWLREPWDDAPATDTQEDSATEGEGSS